MESLFGGMRETLEAVLGRLYRILLLLGKQVVTTPLCLARDLPLWTVLLALLIWRTRVARRKRQAARRFAALLAEEGASPQNPGLPPASEACAGPAEAPPRRVCAEDQEMAGLDSLPEDSRPQGSLNTEETTEPPDRASPGGMAAPRQAQMRVFKEALNTPRGQVAQAKNTSRVSPGNRSPIAKAMWDDVPKIAFPEENSLPFSREAAKCSEGAWEPREEQQTCVKIAMND